VPSKMFLPRKPVRRRCSNSAYSSNEARTGTARLYLASSNPAQLSRQRWAVYHVGCASKFPAAWLRSGVFLGSIIALEARMFMAVSHDLGRPKPRLSDHETHVVEQTPLKEVARAAASSATKRLCGCSNIDSDNARLLFVEILIRHQ
jgi:hypothetical protein